jgi:hypothetical protein
MTEHEMTNTTTGQQMAKNVTPKNSVEYGDHEDHRLPHPVHSGPPVEGIKFGNLEGTGRTATSVSFRSVVLTHLCTVFEPLRSL